MCGIFASDDPFVIKEHEKIIGNSINFRGPDGNSGLMQKNGWSTYHARLAIIDLKDDSNQPYMNSDGSQLIYNGEILNYKELSLKYFNVEYDSDVKLLNDLIINKKLNLSELDGFFAFVFIDGNGQLKYACRDKFGVKPLFYMRTPQGQRSFSSEPNVLIKIYGPSLNENALTEYRAFRYPIFSKSFFSGINEVEPGTCLVNGKYFDLESELSSAKRFDLNLENLEDAVKNGVESRCVSDAPVGLLLSRGIDSNLIRKTHEFDRLYSIGFAGDEDIEFLKVAHIANLKIKSTNAEEFVEAFSHLLYLRQEPMSVPNEVLLYLIGKEAARDGVKVLLSGEGADEFFAGYDRIFRWAKTRTTFDVFEFCELYCYSNLSVGSCLMNYIKEMFDNCKLITVFDKVRWFFIKYHLPVLFRRLDFSLMAAGIEGREPIANSHLFNICKSLSANQLLDEKLGKLPLRQLVERHMGHEFAYTKKTGFPVDLTQVFPNPGNLKSYELWFENNLKVFQ